MPPIIAAPAMKWSHGHQLGEKFDVGRVALDESVRGVVVVGAANGPYLE